MKFTRRNFIKTSALAGSALLLGRTSVRGSFEEKKISISGFTKELQELSYEETAKTAKIIGWDGIECPVRPGGHVLPERVEEDLPKMNDELIQNGLSLDVIATNIHHPFEMYTETLLRTAADLGVKYYRLGWWNYDLSKSLDPQLNEIKSQLRDLATLNKELNIIGLYQNHSGRDSFGAPVWDIFQLLEEVNSDYLGSHFDIGHATVEGGYAWPINFHRIKNKIGAVIVKDFKWVINKNNNWEVEWCPLGDGQIDSKFFKMLDHIKFSGPVTMHYEYKVRGKGKERINNLISVMTKDTQVLRSWLA